MIGPAPRIEFFTSTDGYRCALRVWESAEPQGRIVFLHGIVSHGGWYLQSCRHLANAGFEVHFLDRRGSGLNAPARGDVDGYQTWLDDVQAYLESLPAQPGRILCGVSWGGKLAAAVARRSPQSLDGLGLLCPGLFAQQGANGAQRLALTLAGAVGLGRRHVPIPLRDPALFTDGRQWQAYIRNDPFTLRTVTIRFALADLQLTRYAAEAPEQIGIPTLLMLAGRDRIVDNQRVLDFATQINSGEKTIIQYPQSAHTLEFEPDRRQFLEDLVRWAGNLCRPSPAQSARR